MTNPLQVLTERFSEALTKAFGEEYAGTDPVIRPSDRAKFGADFQANVALALAKQVGLPPREVAARILEHLDISDVAEAPEVSGPGFLNLTLRTTWVAAAVAGLDDRLGVPQQESAVVVIDYSAPNVAKEMHVGHLRTTVVGDALARTLEHLGHRVVRQNHVGDWGTNFGMLLEYLLEVGEDSPQADLLVTSPNDFYQAARVRFDGDEDFATRARQRVVTLQSGDPETLRIWEGMMRRSRQYFNAIYRMLDVTLTDDHLAGESTYNDDLAGICTELEEAGIATTSEGALCVFLEEFTGREGKPVPLIIRKSDGGYGYATTDLATIKHRITRLGADQILYVVGDPQSLHLQMIFATARAAGWLGDDVAVEHVKIGNVLGADKKILRTRAGSSLKLMALLQEAVVAAGRVVDAAGGDFTPEQRDALAWQVGIGAVKYADLSVSHSSEYVFDLERMVALTGNTGPYLQYAAARIRSILRRAATEGHAAGDLVLTEEPERVLALSLLGFGEVVALAGALREPHRLCTYLFDLAQAFTGFYENCPVLRAEDDAVRASRLALAERTLDVLVAGLGLLGIQAPEQM